MRDINRIDRILGMLKTIWEEYPDWRFCQLYVNLFGNGDNFYVEDDRVEKGLEKAISDLVKEK